MKHRNIVYILTGLLFMVTVAGFVLPSNITGFVAFDGMQFDPSGPPTSMNADEQCVQDCVDRDCSAFNKESGSTDMTQAEMQANMAKYEECMSSKQTACDEECNMVQGPDLEDMGEEEKCISECVAAEDSTVICGSSQEGETGNALCQRCAEQCVHLYEGPCLNDEQIIEKEDVCSANCEHCYGEPVEGPSGEGWDCIVDIKCGDASAEFGDDSGEGPDSYEEGHEPSSNNVVSELFEGIAAFFGEIFG
jgi:hypothetical protein